MTTTDEGIITVVLADDHPIVLDGFAAALETVGIQVVGRAHTTDEARRMYFGLKPDVLVLDIRFASESQTGLDLAKSIISIDAGAKIVFLSQFDQEHFYKEAYQIGCLAFLKKDCSAAEFICAVTRANENRLYFPPAIAQRLAEVKVQGDTSPQHVLDARERLIFKHLALGLTTAEIAEKMSLSARTVSSSVHSIKVKTGLHRPADITLLAVRTGFIRD